MSNSQTQRKIRIILCSRKYFEQSSFQFTGRYWKNLYIDYRDVAIDVVKDCKAHPILASTYGSCRYHLYFNMNNSYLTVVRYFCHFNYINILLVVALLVYLNKHNPDETSFREHLLQNSIRVMQVGEPLRNPISEQHIKWLQNCYDEGIIRRMDLGIISLIWLDNYDTACSLYKAVCPHLKPRYVTFYERIVDVGFIDKWWILENKMKDYDVNEAEFANV